MKNFLNSNFFKTITIMVIIVIGLTNFSTIFFHTYYPDGHYSNIYKDEKVFNEVVTKMVADIRKTDKFYNRSIHVFTNDNRIALRLWLFFLEGPDATYWGYNYTIWADNSKSIIDFWLNSPFTLLAVTNITLTGYKLPDFSSNSRYHLIDTYSIGYLYLVI